ncbi:aspartate/glutamate racemase family protein [Fructobacillus sp. M2-14]|uniref:Aspartate/glutamate racemase family protein n=1 Tax=Fructobacillus broussonetiae TaxID=2713173 RepID=A0ABS5QYD3_9LACO|nr:aspartate/glutamate racemase family protein [Fructobacillus broussonetiae]MBS9338160.1 aspartate/glutamate racemase family protein [Fructobacillus broussonetiae]
MTNNYQNNCHSFAGYTIGILAPNLDYEKTVGNVANANTFDFPVLYEIVDIDLELLFKGDASLNETIVSAAKKLEEAGVRAIIGACGFFAHFQDVLKNNVNIPVFTSSLLQVPLIESSLASDQKIAVFAANGENIKKALSATGNHNVDRYVLVDVTQLDEFSPIRYGVKTLDNHALEVALADLAKKTVEADPSIGAVLLECSDLPPYAKAVQEKTGLSVFDFNTLINFVHQAVDQRHY